MLGAMRSRVGLLGCCVALSWGCSGGNGSSGPNDAGQPYDATATTEGGDDGASNDDTSSDGATSNDGATNDGTSGYVDSATGDGGMDTGANDATVSKPDGAVDAAVDAPVDAPSNDANPGDATAADAALDDAEAGTGNVVDAADAAPPTPIVTYVSGVTVSTLAGSSNYGDVDGPDASFANPTGIALYGSDGVIVVENDTGAIRTVSATGDTKTVGTSPVDKAQTSPFTIVAGSQGYYYSTDFDQSGSHVDGGGAVWTFVPNDAGSGTSSLVTGGLYLPRTLVPLSGGDVFVFDTGTAPFSPVTQGIAERLTPGTGTLTVIAGHRGQTGFANGDGGAALFGSTTVGGVLLPDGSGVVVADCTNSQLRMVSLDGTVSTYAGSTTAGWVDGPQASALFSCPHALAIDALGNIYVSDWNNNAIRRVTPSGDVTTLAGNGTLGYADGAGNIAEFYGAEGLVVSADGTTLYVADGTEGNGTVPYNRIRKISLPTPDGG
jgi:sugar lactone lactonase YvrE